MVNLEGKGGMKRKGQRSLLEKAIEIILFVGALSSIIIVFLIIAYMSLEAYPALNLDFLLGWFWDPKKEMFGIFQIIVSTLYVGVGAILITTAIGVPTAIFLAEFCPRNIRNVIKPSIELLVGIPTIVLGFFGLMVVIPFIRDNFGGWGTSVLAGWMILAIMSLPHVISISEDALRAVPNSYKEAALALGATRWQTVKKVLLPHAKTGILASILLALGRVMGETMAVTMVIGNPRVAWIPTSILDRAKVLTSTILLDWSYVEIPSMHYHSLFGIGLVLFFIVALIDVTAIYMVKRGVIK